jgi:hypothetical protein
MFMRLLPGTLLFRKDVYKHLVDHYGIVVQEAPCYVAHIDKTDTGHLNVKLDPYHVFAGGWPVQAEFVDTPIALPDIWKRLEWVRQNKLPYGMLCWGPTWNCESFARYVRSGLAVSRQASDANGVLGIVAAIGSLIWLASQSSDTPRSNPSSAPRHAAASTPTPTFDHRTRRYRDPFGRFVAAPRPTGGARRRG